MSNSTSPSLRQIFNPHLLDYTLHITFPWPLSTQLGGSAVGTRMFGDYNAGPDWQVDEVTNAFIQLSKIGINNIDRGNDLLASLDLSPTAHPKESKTLERIVGLMLLLDQGGRYTCSKGTNARYIYQFFDVLASSISTALIFAHDKPNNPLFFNLASWEQAGIPHEHALLRILMVLAPLIHSDDPKHVETALSITENLRVQYEKHTATVDPYRSSYEDDCLDIVLIARILRDGPPRGNEVRMCDFLYWMMRYYTSHLAYVKHFGRSPIRNVAVGRDDAGGEVEWLAEMGIQRTSDDEEVREMVKDDIRHGRWTPLEH